MNSRRIAFVALCLALGCLPSATRWAQADDYEESDFNFTEGTTTTPRLGMACMQQEDCFPSGCQTINPAFVPPGDTTLRLSFQRSVLHPWGKCVTVPKVTCDEKNGVKCAELVFYAKSKCGGVVKSYLVYKDPGCVP